MPWPTVRGRTAGLPRSVWGTAIAHAGMGMTLLGIVCASTWGEERIVSLKPAQSVSLAGYDLSFDGMDQRAGPNFRELSAKFTVREGGTALGGMNPSKRTFVARNTSTTEAALMTRGVSQLYMSLGDVNADGSIAVRVYFKPLVLLIWLGTLVMALGGALSLSDRRLRVGAPKPAKKSATPTMQPAE
jgi:cytochrome c-type biogenesis protein CcmF